MCILLLRNVLFVGTASRLGVGILLYVCILHVSAYHLNLSKFDPTIAGRHDSQAPRPIDVMHATYIYMYIWSCLSVEGCKTLTRIEMLDAWDRV